MTNELVFGSGSIIGKSKPIRHLFGLIPYLAAQENPVLIQGESGTGKELVATAIHSYSQRSLSPLIKVNCSAIDETYLDVELFGGVKETGEGKKEVAKGLFEIADGGTILLDCIDKLPPAGQEKLSQVMSEHKIHPLGVPEIKNINVRVLATTESSLAEAVGQGAFNEGLYNQLQNNVISMPALRKFREDIPLLVKHFATKYSKKHNKSVKGISAEALSILMEYDWPGNIKELEECIEQAVIIEDLEIIQAHSLPYDLFHTAESARHRLAEEYNLRRRLKAFERQLILRALNETKWKKKEAAQLMGIDQRNLSYFLRKHHITDPATREKERGYL
ncbi:MAG: sigma-54-dependent Fis family transcriptional regulator [Candidatus Schekmanbacteria bacterium]|nr:sigma-54-dependent Fis family transcriptional regulator [Candidatus Schekmanbacteria bacterium]